MGIRNKFEKDFLYYASLGHKTKFVDPKAYLNIIGYRKNVSVINTERTKKSLFLTIQFLRSTFLQKNASILFINLNEESKSITNLCALRSITPFLTKNWSSGTFTNIIFDHKVDVIFVLGSKSNYFVIQEANKSNIPVIGLVDSDTNSNMLSFPIWINDDSDDLCHKITSNISDTIIESKLLNYGFSCL